MTAEAKNTEEPPQARIRTRRRLPLSLNTAQNKLALLRPLSQHFVTAALGSQHTDDVL